jgi:anti-anti-sigma factor
VGRNGRGLLRIVGEIDLSVADELLREALAQLHGGNGLDLDLGGVTFLDSSGLGTLLRLRNEAENSSKSLSLFNVSASVMRLLEVTGLTGAFTVQSAEGSR